MRKTIALVTALVGTAFAGTAARAQQQPSQEQAKLSSKDRSFLDQAARSNLAEVQLAKVAQDKAQSSTVKQLADQMQKDHSSVNDQLSSLAQQKNVTLPTEPGSKETAEADRLQSRSGAQFDRAYMNQLAKMHEKDIALFKRESTKGTDPDVKAFASSTLPKLEDHLTMIREDMKQLDQNQQPSPSNMQQNPSMQHGTMQHGTMQHGTMENQQNPSAP